MRTLAPTGCHPDIQGAGQERLGQCLPDLNQQELTQWVKGISAHSTRIDIANGLFAAGEDIAGIMDALRWKSPRMPLSYNRNLAVEHDAAGRLLTMLEEIIEHDRSRGPRHICHRPA